MLCASGFNSLLEMQESGEGAGHKPGDSRFNSLLEMHRQGVRDIEELTTTFSFNSLLEMPRGYASLGGGLPRRFQFSIGDA